MTPLTKALQVNKTAFHQSLIGNVTNSISERLCELKELGAAIETASKSKQASTVLRTNATAKVLELKSSIDAVILKVNGRTMQ